MNFTVVSRGADLVEWLAGHLEGKDKDYSNSLVVFPGKRPAHFLRRVLAGKVGSSFIPPTIFSIDEFVDFLCGENAFLKKVESIDAVAILYELHKGFQNQIGGNGFVTLDSFFPLGMKIYKDLEELMIEGVKVGQLRNVEAYIEEGIPKFTNERLQTLSWFYEEFYKKVNSLGYLTRSIRYKYAVERIPQSNLDRFNQIFISGFFALTFTEKELFKSLSCHENTFLVFQEGLGLAEKLKDLGFMMEPADQKAPDPQIFFYSSPDTHGEVLALGNELNSRLEKEDSRAESTVILLSSSESLFPLLRQGLSKTAVDSFNISLGYPVFRTPVFGFFERLMDLVTSMDGDKVYIPDYLKFVLHPYSKNIYFEGSPEITRILFHTLEAELLKKKAQTFVRLAEIEGNDAFFRNMTKIISGTGKALGEKDLRDHLRRIHKESVEKFLSIENIADFGRKGVELLDFIFNNSPAKFYPLFLPFADSLINAFEVLSQSLLKEFSFNVRSSYFIFLRKYIATCHTPFAGTPLKGLQILGALEIRNLKFKSVFVLDANEEILPETKQEESLIPFRARQILNLPTYNDRDKLTAYYFDILLGGADDVHLFFIENNKTEKSRFVEKLLWEREKIDKTSDVRKYIRTVQYRVNLINKSPDPIAKTGEMLVFLKDFNFSATAVDQYLKCPLKFYYGSVLKLKPKEKISGDIERDQLGSFVHRILSDFFSGKKGRNLVEKDLDNEEMEALVENLFGKIYGDEPSGALYLLRRQVKRHLNDFLKDYTLPLIRNNRVTILACEEKIEVKASSFKLSGRIDRIDQRNDKIVIVDYKTGFYPDSLKIELDKNNLANREDWNKAIGSLQLPFYILLYSEKEQMMVEKLEATYIFLGRSKMGQEIEFPLFNKASAADRFPVLKSIIFELLQEITDPSVPFFPAFDKKKHCPGCDYQTLCGTQWILK